MSRSASPLFPRADRGQNRTRGRIAEAERPTGGRAAGEPPAARLRFALFVAGSVVLLTAPRLLLHELWRDEAWLWLVVTGSGSLADLFPPLERSGQGYLFPLLCFAARQLSTSPLALQGLHLVLVGAGAFAFVRWAPFGRLERALFVFGYFPFYEYAVLSRHYVLGALLAWLALVAARSGRPALALGAALGLLCQTTVYGWILALALASGWWLDRRLRGSGAPPWSRGEAAAGLGLALAGAVAGVIQLVPSPGTSFAPGWNFAWDPARAGAALAMPWRAFVPLPRPELHFWNSNVLDRKPGLLPLAGVLALATATALLLRKRAALATFWLGGAGLLAFGYVKYVGHLRHHGHWWLLFAGALWLGWADGPAESGRGWRSRALLALLALHVASGAFASWMDLRHPFSSGAATAALLGAKGLDTLPLLGYREPPAATVALYLGRPLFFPSRGVYASYPDWGPGQRDLGEQEVRCVARGLALREGRDVVLVLNRGLPAWGEVEEAGSCVGAIHASEDYHLYRLRLDRLGETAPDARCEGEVFPAEAGR